MNGNFHLRIELANPCFDDDPAQEVGLILRDLASRLMMDGFEHAGVGTSYGACCGIWERNGNHCGHWRVVLLGGDDPTRLEAMTREELEVLLTSINLRMCQLNGGGRECDCSEERENQILASLDREIKDEIERRDA